MGIDIKIANSEISGSAEVMNDLSGSDMAVEIDHVKIDCEAKVLNNMTDAQINYLLEQLKEQKGQLNRNGKDYRKIVRLFADINKGQASAKNVLMRHLPDLLTGTLANVISSLLVR